jgi:aryl-alcohol dehydrogenase-like predicted oxidoreductase
VRYKLLGRSGLRVSEVALGTMTFGTDWGWGSAQAEAKEVFDSFAEAGGTFLDTANIYQDGNSERMLKEFMGSDRDHFVLATKYSGEVGGYSRSTGAPEGKARANPTASGDISRSGNSRKNMIRSVEESLKRLGTDFIDLFYLHFWDETTPVDEVMRSLDDLVSAGKVRYIALSDTPAWVTAQASTLAQLRGWAPVVAVQVEYSLVQRTSEREVLPMARALDLAVVSWAPLGGGALISDPRRTADTSMVPVVGSRGLDRSAIPEETAQRYTEIATVVSRVAESLGAKNAQVALAWVRQQADRFGVVIPILGARTAAQLDENIASLGIRLDADQMEELDRVSEIELGFPLDMINSQLIRSFKTSGKHHLLDNHRL